MMKRNLTYRIIAGCLSFLLMFGLIPTGVLSDLMPEIVPDVSVEADAANGTGDRLCGLFYVRVNTDRSLYLTNSNWYPTPSTFTTKKSGDDLLSQMWLFITGNDGNLYIRSLSDVMAYYNGTWGDRWLCWDYSTIGYNHVSSYTLKGGSATDAMGNPTAGGAWKWKVHNLAPQNNNPGAYTCAIRRHDDYRYLQNVGNQLYIGQDSDTSGTYFYLEPCYDPMFVHTRPLQFNNQPGGDTSYRLNDTGSDINMVIEGTNTVKNTWAAVEAEQGYYYLINRGSGKYLSASDHSVTSKTLSASTNPRTDASIQWQIIRQRYTKNSAGQYFSTYIIVNKGTGYILQSNGSDASTGGYDFGNSMYTYFTIGYNADFGDEVPETPQFYGWDANTYRYYPATFTNQPGYVALQAKQAKSIDGDLPGYLFDTSSLTKLGSTAQSLTDNSTNHYWYNSGYAGFSEWPTAHSLGTTRIVFNFTKASGQFIWIIGHGTQVTATVDGKTYTVTDGITKITPGTSGTATVDITASGHFGIFTNIEPAAQSGSVTVSMSGTDNQVIHGETSYTVTVHNGTNYPIDNVSFSVGIGGGHTVTVTVTNGSISSGNTAIATVSGSGRAIAAGGDATFTIKMLPSGMTAGTNYTLTANEGTYISYKNFTSQPNATNTISRGTTYSKTLQECNGNGITAAVTVNPNGGLVSNNVVYTISLTNKCNHAMGTIGFKFADVLTVANGKSTLTKSGVTVSGLAEGKTISAGGTWDITVTVPVSTMGTGAKQYSITDGTCTASGATGTCTKTFGPVKATSVTPVSGNVTMTVTSSVSDSAVVHGKVVYTIIIKNGTNHSINNVNFTLKAGNIDLLTVTNGKFTMQDYVETDISSIDTLAATKSVTLIVTVYTDSLSANTSYAISTTKLTCAASNLAAGQSRTLTVDAKSVQTIKTTTRGGVTASASANVTSGVTVEGSYYIDITISNAANHDVNNFTFVVKNNNTAIVTVTNSAVKVNATDYVTASKSNLGTLSEGGSVTLRITIDSTKLVDGQTYKITVGDIKCTPSGVEGDDDDCVLTATLSYSHSVVIRSGAVEMTWVPSTHSGIVVEGIITYTVTFTNVTNHAITGIDYKLKLNDTDFVIITDSAISTIGDFVTVDKSNLGSTLAAGASVDLLVTIDTTKLEDGQDYTVNLYNGSSNATGIYGSNSNIELKPESNSYTHHFTTRGGNVELTWKPAIDSNRVVEGVYVYDITFTNNTNHKIVNLDYTVTLDGVAIITVEDDVVTKNSSYVKANKTTLPDLEIGESTTMRVTVDTTLMNDGQTYIFGLVGGTANAADIEGTNPNLELNANANLSHVITVREGDITVTLTSTTVSDNGVGEGDVSYTMTMTNGTNHTLGQIDFVLMDHYGNPLLLVNYDGSITILDGNLVKEAGIISGSLTNLASGETVAISDIIIDATSDLLDNEGRLIMYASGVATATDLVGSGANYSYEDESETYTIMVRHHVDLMIQAGLSTIITPETIYAAMDKTGAYGPEKDLGLASDTISALTVTDINGNAITFAGTAITDGNLVLYFTEEYTEFVIRVNYIGGSLLVPIQATTYDAGEDKTFVLDYGLPVSIEEATMLDDVRLESYRIQNTTAAIKGFANAIKSAADTSMTGTFGNFSYDGAFNYETTKFMDNEDVAYIVIEVAQNSNGTEYVDYVNLYKWLSYIPSNVIYYEDTLVGSITYPGGYHLDPMGELAGTGVSGTQDLPTTDKMGYDDGSYANATDVTLSGESVQKVPVDIDQVTVSFSFTGTGFELISRCNAFDAATILVKVRPQGGTDDDWTYYPVITKFDPNGNGRTEVYQVPVFRLNETAFGTYEVQVVGLPMADYDENGDSIGYRTSYIYIDGIRIYNPLGNSDLTNHYGNEKGAQFVNLRDLILNGQGMLAEYTESVTSFTTGSFYYVPHDTTFSAALGSINELGAIGANNEILVRRSLGNFITVLKVKETVAGEGLLQIGVHDIHEAKFDGDDGVNESTSISYKTSDGAWATLISNTFSGTEQYYSVDLSQCPTDGDYKIVILQVDRGFASFTNVKYKNVEFGATGAEVPEIYTDPNYYFNEDGDMCKLEDGVEVVVKTAAEVININKLNGILAQNENN